MATLITGLCVGWGACGPVGPSDGIREGHGGFSIDQAPRTERVGSCANDRRWRSW